MAKKRQTQQDLMSLLYPDLPTSDDFEQKSTEPKDDAAKEIATLREQLAKLQGTVESRPAPIAQRQTKQAPQRPDYQTIAAAAPDPVSDPTGYAKFLADFNQLQINYEKEAYAYQTSQAAEAAGRSNNLWNSFAAKYGDLAKDNERVEIAASKVIAKARASGVDTDKYMYEQSDQFFKDVVAENERLFGKAKAHEDEDDEDYNDDDEDDDRSQVPAGGAPAARSGPAKTQPRQSPFGALSQQINDWQVKTGFTR